MQQSKHSKWLAIGRLGDPLRGCLLGCYLAMVSIFWLAFCFSPLRTVYTLLMYPLLFMNEIFFYNESIFYVVVYGVGLLMTPFSFPQKHRLVLHVC